jgi:hypothetical protein
MGSTFAAARSASPDGAERDHEIMDEDMVEMLRNNPPDVVFSAFSQAFFKGAIRMFQRDAEMKNIVLEALEDPRSTNFRLRV